jgi:tetratricopeptide (TPR) repeat protein
MKRLTIVGLALFLLHGAVFAQTKQEALIERYRGYKAEVQAWLDRREYAKAENAARAAQEFADQHEMNRRFVGPLLAEALFRQGLYQEAFGVFVSSIKNGKNGKWDGMLLVAGSRAPNKPSLTRIMPNWVYGSESPVPGEYRMGLGSASLEAIGWLTMAIYETGAIGEEDAREAIKLAPAAMTAWFVLGLRQMETKKFTEAIESFRKVVKGNIHALALKAEAKILECEAAVNGETIGSEHKIL